MRLNTRGEERKVVMEEVVVRNPSSSKGGVVEKSILVCEECKDELCTGACIVFQYESYQVSTPYYHILYYHIFLGREL